VGICTFQSLVWLLILQSSPGPSVTTLKLVNSGFLSSFFDPEKSYIVSIGSLVYFYAKILDSLRGDRVVESKM
jgi:hypothetical protein